MKQDALLTDDQLERINSELAKQGVEFDMSKINHLLELGYLADLFTCEPRMIDRQAWKKALGIWSDTTRFDDAFKQSLPYEVTVSYESTLKEMVRAGNFSWHHPSIVAEKFPVVGIGSKKFSLRLIHFGCNVTPEEVTDAIVNYGWIVAGIEHLLAFAQQFPLVQDDFLVAVAVACDDAFMRDYFPSLGNMESNDRAEKSKRIVKLDQLNELKPYWNASYRFLAIDPT